MIGGGEAFGQIMASWFYAQYNFGVECDAYNITNLLSFLAVLWLDYYSREKHGQSSRDKVAMVEL